MVITSRRFPSFSPTWLVVLAFFLGLLVTGLLIYQDYGLSWDETTQVELGLKSYRYVMRHDPALLEFRDRYYGPLFEMLLILFQSRGASREMYFSRHLINFLTFFAGCLGFFALGKYLYKKTWLALLGSLFLVLSPRIFAHAFYNSKDIPFLVFYVFSLLSLIILLDRPNWLTAALHGLVTAALLAVRLPGLVIPALTLFGLLIEVAARRVRWPRAIGSAVLYLVVSVAALVLFWPALWPNPPQELLEAFSTMSNYPHLTEMLYLGQTITSDALPWHYIPVWIIVTTPILYLLLMGLGAGWLVSQWVKAPRSLLCSSGRNDIILLGALFLPLLAVILLHSTLYDDWRQMFFIYPPLLLIGLRGLEGLFAWLNTHLPRRLALLGLSMVLLIGIAPQAVWMIANHPYQNVYFNVLAGRNMRSAQARFPMDYWGLSYRQGLDYILKTDPAEKIAVYAETVAGERSAAIFPTQDEKRLVFVRELSQAKYYLGNYYYHPAQRYPFKNEVFHVQAGGAKILSVFLLSDEEKH